ncbi:hypothetical protein D3C83_202280 [compost metagenome]
MLAPESVQGGSGFEIDIALGKGGCGLAKLGPFAHRNDQTSLLLQAAFGKRDFHGRNTSI